MNCSMMLELLSYIYFSQWWREMCPVDPPGERRVNRSYMVNSF